MVMILGTDYIWATPMSRLREIANQVRRKCEIYADQTGNWGEDLCGMCAIASAALKEALSRAGFDSKIIHGYNGCLGHCWVEIGDTIYDITATQFGGDAVTIVSTDDEFYQEYKEPRTCEELETDFPHKLSTFNEMIEWFELNCWDNQDIPTKEVVKEILDIAA